jgi:hypothetical protein
LHDSSLQRVVAQAFPSARPDLVDAAFASPPSPSQLRLLQVLPLCPSLSHTPVSRPHFFVTRCLQQLLLVAFPDQVARICKQQSGSKRREYDVCGGAEGPFVVAAHSQLRHSSHDYLVYELQFSKIMLLFEYSQSLSPLPDIPICAWLVKSRRWCCHFPFALFFRLRFTFFAGELHRGEGGLDAAAGRGAGQG